jgi:hypothetical protein
MEAWLVNLFSKPVEYSMGCIACMHVVQSNEEQDEKLDHRITPHHCSSFAIFL